MKNDNLKFKNSKIIPRAESRGYNNFSFFIFTFSLIIGLFGMVFITFAASNISSGILEHWAWNDVIGWIDFKAAPDNVRVFNDRLEGYAGSSIGLIALNCNSTPNGDLCPPGGPIISNFKVANNGSGLLSGYGWNDNIGWISFWCGNEGAANCAGGNYQVSIDANGDFSGFAWNEVAGFISFNCNDDFDPVTPGIQSNCGASNYKINTSWRTGPAASGDLTSSVFDTGISEGAALNTVMWQGTKPVGTNVKFQIASSNSSAGPWIFVGPNNSTTDYYAPAGPDASLELDRDDYANKRYFRYKVFLEANAIGDAAPTVDDIIINWSR